MKTKAIGIIYAAMVLTSCNPPQENFDKQRISNQNDSWLTEYIEPPSNVPPSETYTFLCEVLVQRPETLTRTCADFGEKVFDIEWKTWGIEGAEGTGIYSFNDCNPDCAEGTRSEVPVSLRLDRVTTNGEKYFLNFLNISSKNFLIDDIYMFWDLSEFYREVPSMRMSE